jgi:hypothetical protein
MSRLESPTLLSAALALREHLQRAHLVDGLLRGPDPSGRFNLRVGRFIGFRRPAPWTSFQAAGYWIRLNALLGLSSTVRDACEAVLERQRLDGSWPFKDDPVQVATFEGTWAALGLVEGTRLLGDQRYVDGARRWIDYLVRSGSFRPYGSGTYVAYWADTTFVVPNNTVEVLWLLSELGQHDAELARGLLTFLKSVQLPSGELPYRVPDRPHYLCYQYNAFELLALCGFAQNARAAELDNLLARLAGFLGRGLAASGAARTSCSVEPPEVHYYTAALALALWRAENYAAAERAVRRLLAQQQPDGSFGYSRADYGLPFLHDNHSYPRPQAIIAYCLAMLAHLTAPEG